MGSNDAINLIAFINGTHFLVLRQSIKLTIFLAPIIHGCKKQTNILTLLDRQPKYMQRLQYNFKVFKQCLSAMRRYNCITVFSDFAQVN